MDTDKKIQLNLPEIKDEYDKMKISLIQDFPECYQPISLAIDCERENRGKSAKEIEKQCYYEKSHMNFCILSTFCPTEARDLIDCYNGNIIAINSQNHKKSKCSQLFNIFDACLQKKTEQLEKEMNDSTYKPPPPKAKVVYVNENTKIN
ncbi:hypothetical protein DLAC_04933 [Tieghemostelium lacteum]|uniref:Uncharacterized protein n=1 Tax=Tieghemostelium lacteum TaxID=361077 RepID=A0A151ZHU9_TIELA|nr:hypothetical protein DLAC_04933 [Tieghemostelium lacteum]|eukprot:KYQ93562.1 hypothetical protein DLAC_04933 [Tieghemostelium lacteum]